MDIRLNDSSTSKVEKVFPVICLHQPFNGYKTCKHSDRDLQGAGNKIWAAGNAQKLLLNNCRVLTVLTFGN